MSLSRPWRGLGWAALVAIPLVATALDLVGDHRVIKDEVQHLAYVRSLALDRDLDFGNDFRELWPKYRNRPWLVEKTQRAPNTAALGAPLLWLPAWAVAHAFGSPAAERAACVFTSAALGSLGIYLAYRLARERTNATAAALGAAWVTAASFFGHWLLHPGLYAHAPAIGLVSAFVYLWWRGLGSPDPKRWALLGLLAGFLTVVRWQNIWLPFVCGAIELVWVLAGWLGGETGLEGAAEPPERLPAWARWRRVAVCGVVYAATTFLGLAPQLFAWKAIYGTYLPQTGGGTFLQWLNPYAIDLLFSPRYGLLGFSPWLYLPVGGVAVAVARFRRDPVWIVAGLYVTIAIYLNACLASVSWYGGATFGPRRLDSLFPFLVLGGAHAAERSMQWWRRAPAAPLACVGLAGAVWMASLSGAYRSGAINVGMVGAERFPWAAPAAFVDRFGWPPAWPAELYYALRDGLRWGQYTQLAGADPVPFGDGSIDLARPDRRHLGTGWRLVDGAPEFDFDPTEDARRTHLAVFGGEPRHADLFVYLMDLGLRESNLRVELRFAGKPPGVIELNGRRLGGSVEPASDGAVVWRAQVADEQWRAGVNRLECRVDGSYDEHWRVLGLRIVRAPAARDDDG